MDVLFPNYVFFKSIEIIYSVIKIQIVVADVVASANPMSKYSESMQDAIKYLNRCPDWHDSVAPRCCVYTTPCCPPCCPEDCPSNPPPNCYKLTIPPEMGDQCFSKVSYDFGPCGISRKVKNKNGNSCDICYDSAITLETYQHPGGCSVGTDRMLIQSHCKTADCCPCLPLPCPCPCPCPEEEVCMIPCCPKPRVPPPCKIRKRVQCCKVVDL